MSYGWLFENPDDDISVYNHINLEHLPPELKQVALQIVQNQFDRDTAEKKLAELIQQLEFDITAAELSAYLFKPGHA
ncbi:hypothetical protein FCG73_021445 [Klebsiella pneumoniae]|uniref:hypothetical protein n=1 Tax=Klebsiella pneumoniae TaxID=573 RepID=UPI0011421D94|nr:hypothetical protein [Klebsiella pneumoniae]EIW0093323.1 hypothetical protein [Klebsiella pneumoniae]TYX25507.1 hypothetical protein FCG78_019800 [Klebsiella pneumoniae]TYX37613.1 hypothetical protein FCG70_021020 [Klebsiella pneumoniae]TYX48459.1 hypothetical protein FCG73_021445 [Klebsiella pneumoniae]TYY55444.1 hypothetical protein FCG98_020460 [Klebsiella pneumoniae]